MKLSPLTTAVDRRGQCAWLGVGWGGDVVCVVEKAGLGGEAGEMRRRAASIVF